MLEVPKSILNIQSVIAILSLEVIVSRSRRHAGHPNCTNKWLPEQTLDVLDQYHSGVGRRVVIATRAQNREDHSEAERRTQRPNGDWNPGSGHCSDQRMPGEW